MSWRQGSRALLIAALVSALPYWIMHGAGLRDTTAVISATGTVDPVTQWTGALYVLCFMVHWTVAPVLVIAAGLHAAAGWVHRRASDRFQQP